MTLNTQLYNKISTDLKEDFPKIKEITKEDDNTIKIIADDDTLWNIFEVLFNGVENIEFNAGQNQTHYILITI